MLIDTLQLIFKRFLPKLGKEVVLLNFASLIVGFLVFASEFLFIYALQGFFKNLGFISFDESSIPKWYPKDPYINILILMSVGFLRVGTNAGRKYITAISNQLFLRKFRIKFFKASILNKNSTATFEMINLFTDNLSRTGTSLVYTTGLIISGSSVIFLFFSGLYIAPQEMIVGIMSILFFAFPIRVVDQKVKKIGSDLTDSWKDISKNLVDGMRNHLFFKAHGIEDTVINRSSESIIKLEHSHRRYSYLIAIKNSVPALAGILVLISISYFSFKFTKKADQSAIVPLLYIILRVSQGLAESSTLISQIILNKNSVQGFLEWNKKIDENISEAVVNKKSIKNDLKEIVISSKDISFQYDNQKIFDKLNFTLEKGDTFIIKGQSGSGKSTLISLLLGIQRPTSGKLLLNNNNLFEEINLFRDIISYVGPDPMLFVGTIRENLLFGNKNAHNITDEQIFESLDKVGLRDFIDEKKEKLEFLLNENAEASTGQKQRLSLARSILRSPTLLIMDEATANLDNNIEKQILDEILKDKNDMLVIIITHKSHLNNYGNKFIDLDLKEME